MPRSCQDHAKIVQNHEVYTCQDPAGSCEEPDGDHQATRTQMAEQDYIITLLVHVWQVYTHWGHKYCCCQAAVS